MTETADGSGHEDHKDHKKANLVFFQIFAAFVIVVAAAVGRLRTRG